MNWKNIKNLIKKELKESKNILNEGLVCGPHKCGQGQACQHQCTPSGANSNCSNCNYGCFDFKCIGGYNVTNDTATKRKKTDGSMVIITPPTIDNKFNKPTAKIREAEKCRGVRCVGPADCKGEDQTCNTVAPGCKVCGPIGGSKTSKSFKKIKEAEVTAGSTKFNLRTGVNKNPTKLGIKIQFEPKGGMLASDVKAKLEVALQEKLNTALAEYDIQVSKDTDVPRVEVIGFFIPLSQLKNLIVKSLTGKKVEAPKVPAPTPTAAPTTPTTPPMPKSPVPDDVDEMINEQLLNEALKVKELNEISKTVVKEDFYGFINAGQNILRTLDDNNIQKGKKYLEYLVKHNII